MGAASVSEYVASLNEEQRRHVSAFIDFMGAEYPQLTPKISSYNMICRPFCKCVCLVHLLD